jgi:hypothetical protein
VTCTYKDAYAAGVGTLIVRKVTDPSSDTSTMSPSSSTFPARSCLARIRSPSRSPSVTPELPPTPAPAPPPAPTPAPAPQPALAAAASLVGP